MKITEQNREIVKAFMRIMIDIGVSRTSTEMITSMLKNQAQMDALVLFLEQNPNLTEMEILDKAQEIAGL